MAMRRCLAVGRSTSLRWLCTGRGHSGSASSAGTPPTAAPPTSPPTAAAKDQAFVQGDQLAQSFMLPWERAAFDRTQRSLSSFEKAYWGVFAGALVSWALYSAWTTPRSPALEEDPILSARRKKEAARELEMRRRERVLALATGQVDASGDQSGDLFDGMDPAEIDKYVTATMQDLRSAVTGRQSREGEEGDDGHGQLDDLFEGLEPTEIDRLLALESDVEAREQRANATPLLQTVEDVKRERDRLRRRH